MFSLKGVEKLTQIFERYADTREDTFSTSLPYYLLTGRRECHVCTDGVAYLPVMLHPHIENKVLIFPEINGNGQLTIQVLNKLAYQNIDVRLARYAEDDYKNLVDNLAFESKENNFIKSITRVQENIMDWKFPIRVVDTKTVSDLTGKSFENLRNKFNKVNNQLEVIPLNDSQSTRKMQAGIMFWAGSMLEAGRQTGHDMTEFYDTLVTLVTNYPAMFDGFVIQQNKETIGFTVWDKSSALTANGIAGLSRRSVSGLSEFQTITACRILNAQGISRYNLGGSETIGLDKFKLKFNPVAQIDINSYDVQFSMPNMNVFALTQRPQNKIIFD